MAVLALERRLPQRRFADLRPVRRPRWLALYARSLVALDAVLASVAAVTALLVRFDDAAITAGYLLVTLAFPIAWVLSASIGRAFEPRFLGHGSEEYRRVFDSGVRLLALAALVSYGAKAELARGYVLIAFPLACILVLIGRYAARRVLHFQRRRGRCVHKVVVTGTERAVAELVRQLSRETYAGLSVVGACVDRSRGPVIEGVPVLGTSQDIVDTLVFTGADTVAVGAWSSLSQADLRRLSWDLEGSGVAFVVAPSVTDIAGPRIHIRPIAGLPLLHIEEPEFQGQRRLIKGLFDRGMALLALLLLAPVLGVIALLVRLTSDGPAFFHQERVGVANGTFRMHKFRTMRVNAEFELPQLLPTASGDVLFKLRQDPRVTSFGRFLRRYSIDELPQLWNVLMGEMSLVGPRPPLAREVAQYGDHVHRRLLVKPGLTGLWQVSGRSDLSWDESVRLDLHYVENWSLALDAMILWKTVYAVLRRRGAY